ncbi:MAG: hypothetical protein IJ722_04680 [Alloprevotella sp.]|nr:hypothetical protein [Alloprevotella sp.]
MKKRKELNAALPGDVRAAEPCADTAPKAKKPYVKPTMQVFPLGCGLLAASGVVTGPPVQITLTPMGIDYYYVFTRDGNRFTHSGLHTGAHDGGFCINEHINTPGNWDFKCGDLGSTFMSKYAAWATALRNDVDDFTDCSSLTYVAWGIETARCGRGILPTPDATPVISFGGGVDWTAEEFFAGAQFDECTGNGKTFSGTYDGRRFEGTIETMEILGD